MWTAAQLAEWTGGEWTRRPDGPLTGVSHDTRKLVPGDLYVALRGERLDGHEYVPHALQAGAVALLVDTPPASTGVPALVVPDTLKALQQWAAYHRAAMPARVVGITGSAGKTTVKELLTRVLEQVGPTTATPGNYNNHIGVPISLLQLRPEHQFGVFEAGMNHPGELDPLFGMMRPDHGILTTIGAAHLEAFEDVAGIAREKAAIGRALPAEGILVTDGGSPWLEVVRDHCRGQVLPIYLQDAGPGEWVADPEAALEGRLDIIGPRSEWSVPIPVPGVAMAQNTLQVAALSAALGVESSAFRAGVAAWRPGNMRWETTRVGDIDVINDAYNANPLSMAAALESFARWPVRGQRWLVLGSMQELGVTAPDEHRALGNRVATGPWAGVVVLGDWAEETITGLQSGGFGGRIRAVEHPAAAAECLHEWCVPGDTVLLKASRSDELEKLLDLWPVPATKQVTS